MNQAELEAFLETNDILGTDRIGAPQALVKVLAIPAAELGRSVVNVVEWPESVDNTLDLSKFTYIAPGIGRLFHIGSKRKSGFIFAVRTVARNNPVIPTTEFLYQSCAYGSIPTSDQYSFLHFVKVFGDEFSEKRN